MKPISLQLYTLRERASKDFVGVLKDVAAIGYKGVEPAGLHGMKPAAVHKVLDDLGLVASSSHCPLPTPENISETVDTAATLGYGLVVSGLGPDDFKTLDAIKATAAKFQASAELLKPHGLRVCYHNHWWEMDKIKGRHGLDIFLELAPDAFSQTDLYWACGFGAVDVPAFVARHASRIPLVHVKDGPLVKGKPHTAVGAGKMDIPACLAATDDSGLDWAVVELDDCATDMTQAVRESYKYLTRAHLAAGNK
jgi:sugar phosphate isomerase/epimerase